LKKSFTPIRGILCGLVLVATLSFPAAAQEPPPEPAVPAQETVSVLKEISYKKTPVAGQLVVTVRLEGTFAFETFALTGPMRLVIDFSPVNGIDAPPVTTVNDAGLRNIRAGQFLPSVARVVFDLDDRAPSYSITSLPDGVRVAFWREASAGVEASPAPVPAEKPVAPVPAPSGLVLRGGPGMTLFFKPEFAVKRDFGLYGETASVTERLNQKIAPVFDVGLGKRINPQFSAGLGVAYQTLRPDPSLEASLPHPFQANTFRQVTFETEDLTENMWVISQTVTKPRQVRRLDTGLWTVTAWGLYSVYQTETIDVSAGPVLGLSFGSLYSLEDFEVTEKSPYQSKDVTLTSVTYTENKFIKLDPGMLLSGAYTLGDNLNVFATLRLHYVDVMVESLQRRASLFRLNLLLGLEYGF